MKATLNSASEFEDNYFSKNCTLPSKYKAYGTKVKFDMNVTFYRNQINGYQKCI